MAGSPPWRLLFALSGALLWAVDLPAQQAVQGTVFVEIEYQGVTAEEVRLERQSRLAREKSAPTKIQYVVIVNLISGKWPDNAEQTILQVRQVFESLNRMRSHRKYGKLVDAEFDIRRLDNADMRATTKELVSQGYLVAMQYPFERGDWKSTSHLFIQEVFEPNDDYGAYTCAVTLKATPTIDERGQIKLNAVAEIAEPKPLGAEAKSADEGFAKSVAAFKASVKAEADQALALLNGKDGAKLWRLYAADKERFANETKIPKAIPFVAFGSPAQLPLTIRAVVLDPKKDPSSKKDWDVEP